MAAGAKWLFGWLWEQAEYGFSVNSSRRECCSRCSVARRVWGWHSGVSALLLLCYRPTFPA
jgi:hypothetical protein